MSDIEKCTIQGCALHNGNHKNNCDSYDDANSCMIFSTTKEITAERDTLKGQVDSWIKRFLAFEEFANDRYSTLETERDTLREEVRLAMVAFGLMFNESDVGKYCPPEHHDGRPCHRPKRDCMECWIEIFFMRAKSLDKAQATPEGK